MEVCLVEVSSVISLTLKKPDLVVDDNGKVECPDCHTLIRVGAAGIGNFKNHRGTKSCIKNLKRYKQEQAKIKARERAAFFFAPRAPRVPAPVFSPTPIQQSSISAHADLSTNDDTCPHASELLRSFQEKIDSLPEDTKKADSSHPLAQWACDPRSSKFDHKERQLLLSDKDTLEEEVSTSFLDDGVSHEADRADEQSLQISHTQEPPNHKMTVSEKFEADGGAVELEDEILFPIEASTTRSGRKRKAKDLNSILEVCVCGNIVDESLRDDHEATIRCAKKDCTTQWGSSHGHDCTDSRALEE
ncbi:hypothetical protein H0H93_007034 [Arthromyces matolae]|nr:hypothetical protein H0H93_007034 [Arthromyces matolae]